MDAKQYWSVFLDSGIPEYYLLYSRAKKLEESHVLDGTGTGTAGLTLQ